MLYIDKVRKTIVNGVELITDVRYSNYLCLNGTNWCSKYQMINYINNHPYVTVKTKYWRYGQYVEGEKVRVVDDEYLRTDSNNIKADNLGEL